MDAPDDYDSPWKEAVESYFPEFIEFYFPDAHRQIDWARGHVFLDQELRAVVQDAELGKRFVDKLAKVALRDGSERWVYVHLEVQGSAQAEFAERMFVYNYRLYDRYRQPVASLAVLADTTANWRPNHFGFAVLGCEHELRFPAVKLLDYATHQDQLYTNPNPFALVTLAHLLTQTTRQDMNARFAAKWKLVQLLYQRGWDKQRVIDLFSVLDWMMRLPEQLKRSLWHNIEVLEEQEKMRYVTSVEQLYSEKWMQQGMQRGLMQGRAEGEAYALRRLLQKRFGPLSEDVLARLQAASIDELELWLDRALDADSLAGVFAQ
ncbi:DUF4351 domain-containing protein [Rivihabitans pingtungensis]|uniref:Uncharacterized protein DUF4351 n=1 Tax=Rivihabitans pingtungensis TaxID=1054498 RepID=A0A318KQK7_9NEIS|nr:DUF4351 domain-containing protein [Rivihabitans pingtungensis]PXX78005.1 uncharacterized protein DUF4351 [Rivihabitans pingtungensis]